MISRQIYLLFFFLGLIALFLFGYNVPDLITNMGHRLPQPDLVGDYTLGLIWGLILGVLILGLPVSARSKRALALVWVVKLAITLGFMLLYESRYGLDAYNYFAWPNKAAFVWEGFKFGSGTHNMMHLSWLHQQIIPNSYHALKVSCAFFGLVGSYMFYRAAALFRGQENLSLFYFIALFPSVLFWSSILGKDPIVFLGIAFYCYGVTGWYKIRRFWFFIPLGLGVILAAFVRIWLGPILLAPLAVFAVFGIRGLASRLVFIALSGALFLFAFTQFQEQLHIQSMQDMLNRADVVSKSWSHGGSGQEIGTSFTSIPKMLAFAPIGSFTALFRPLPGEILNPFGMLAGLENFFVLILLLRSFKRTRLKELKDPLIAWAITLVLIWAFVYGFISYQNMGSAVRFKLQILPVLLGVLLYLSRKRLVPSLRVAPGDIGIHTI